MDYPVRNIKYVYIQEKYSQKICVGDIVIFNPTGSSYVYGSDGVTEPGDIGRVVKITKDENESAHFRYCCYVYFPRIMHILNRKHLAPALFSAHPSELINLNIDLCEKYNAIVQLKKHYGDTGEKVFLWT